MTGLVLIAWAVCIVEGIIIALQRGKIKWLEARRRPGRKARITKMPAGVQQ